MADNAQIIDKITQLGQTMLPKGSSLWLYGSRARGDYHEDSDWDLLILLDKEKLTSSDYDYTYHFRELGWDFDADISAHIYTKEQWNGWTFMPFYKNVEQDKIVLL